MPVEKIYSTHNVIIDKENNIVTKTSSPENPNYVGFQREKAILKHLNKAKIHNGVITMPYYGESGLYDISHIPILKEKLDELREELSDHTEELGITGVYGEEMIDKIHKRCNGSSELEDFHHKQAQSVQFVDPVVVFGDLRPANYCVDFQGNISLIDYESVCLAPAEYDWSTLLLNIWSTHREHVEEFIELGLWSADTLRFKCANSVTYYCWRYNEEVAYDYIDSYAELLDRCGTSWA